MRSIFQPCSNVTNTALRGWMYALKLFAAWRRPLATFILLKIYSNSWKTEMFIYCIIWIYIFCIIILGTVYFYVWFAFTVLVFINLFMDLLFTNYINNTVNRAKCHKLRIKTAAVSSWEVELSFNIHSDIYCSSECVVPHQ